MSALGGIAVWRTVMSKAVLVDNCSPETTAAVSLAAATVRSAHCSPVDGLACLATQCIQAATLCNHSVGVPRLQHVWQGLPC